MTELKTGFPCRLGFLLVAVRWGAGWDEYKCCGFAGGGGGGGFGCGVERVGGEGGGLSCAGE